MIRKSLIVSFVAYLLFFILILIFQKTRDGDGEYLFLSSLYAFIFAGVPIVCIVFLLVLILNQTISKQLVNRTKDQKNKHYFYYSSIASLVPILGFVIFDFSRFNQFGHKGDFINIFLKYSAFIILAFIVIMINRKLVWKNFSDNA